MSDDFGFDERYARTMRHVWEFAHNDQRPAVLDWMARCRPARAVLDIGPGDAYYMHVLRPAVCVLVEPNAVLRKLARDRCTTFCDEVSVIATVPELLQSTAHQACDLVLMIHVLFYMPAAEIERLLPACADRRVAMVHPLPERAVTVEFEDWIGLSDCRNRVEQKLRVLGAPKTRQCSDSHFRVPKSVSDEDLAFLVAHPTLHGPHAQARLAAAQHFVRQRRPEWTRSDFLELPQAQVLETYGF